MHLGWIADQWFNATDAERLSHLNALRGHFQLHIEHCLDGSLLDTDIFVDEQVFDDVIRNYYQDLQRMAHNQGPSNPDDYKQKAFYAFWIRKLKPIQTYRQTPSKKEKINNWANETVAIKIAITELDICYGETDTSSNLMQDLLFYFRYKSVSPHSLYLIFASMYTVNCDPSAFG